MFSSGGGASVAAPAIRSSRFVGWVYVMTDTTLACIGDLPLRLGGMLPRTEVAYVTYGRLAPDGRNAILLAHGYTSSHLFADGSNASEGTWAGLVGPGRPIDTDRYFVVSTNMLGSSYGSTAPSSRNPGSGQAYGPDFPHITLNDIVEAQWRLLGLLGVKELIAVVGPSYGGFQAFCWSVIHPDFVRGVVAAVTGLKAPRQLDIDAQQARLATDTNWNGGHYYEAGGIVATMTAIRAETLRGYGIEQELAVRYPDPTDRPRALEAIAREWARAFDGHSLLVLGRAANAYDVTSMVSKIKAKVLYVLSRTDTLFPPSLAPGVMSALCGVGVDARYHEIDSPHGHLASGVDSALWAPVLASFIAELDPR